jgi:two-component system, chemotaxis family, CheB/CheR fusion protein
MAEVLDRRDGRLRFPDEQISIALEAIRRHTGVDFTGYRRPMIGRRLANHMLAAHISAPDTYLTALVESPAMAQAALQRLTIKVSAFFRNADVFDFVERELLPPLGAARPVRVLCAGCATGEEAWSLAALMQAQAIEGTVQAVDIDAVALAAAAAGRYPAAAVDHLTGTQRQLLGEVDADGQFVIGAALRERLHFTVADITAPLMLPAPTFDLVSCRNVLIYMERERQQACLDRLLAQLRPGGILLLGEAEWPTAILSSLEIVNGSRRVFRRRRGVGVT